MQNIRQVRAHPAPITSSDALRSRDGMGTNQPLGEITLPPATAASFLAPALTLCRSPHANCFALVLRSSRLLPPGFRTQERLLHPIPMIIHLNLFPGV